MKQFIYSIFLIFLVFADLQAALFSRPPHSQFQDVLSDIQYDHVISANDHYLKEILGRVEEFDFSNYKIYLVDNLGLFLLDRKPDWIKDVLRSNQEWESYIVSLIKKYAKPNTLALDVGAHIGTHTLNMSRAVGPQGKVIAFEPQPKTFSELFMNTKINGAPNIWCFWGALGDKIEEIELPNFIPECEVIGLSDHKYGLSGMKAPMVTLDSLDLENISFMKVDVDGCDEIFLKGARATILKNKPVIVMEILGGFNIDTAEPECKSRIVNIQNMIISMGYRLERISVHDYLAIPNESD